jgi:hypothetical protein
MSEIDSNGHEKGGPACCPTTEEQEHYRRGTWRPLPKSAATETADTEGASSNHAWRQDSTDSSNGTANDHAVIEAGDTLSLTERRQKDGGGFEGDPPPSRLRVRRLATQHTRPRPPGAYRVLNAEGPSADEV